MGRELIPQDVRDLYPVLEWKHALAILSVDFPDEFRDIMEVLRGFRLLRSHILGGGGSRSYVSRSLDSSFHRRGWKEKKFRTQIVVDGRRKRVPTHKVDCFKGKVALEIEWSNKDPFFDRDLNNFRLLFDLRAASVGVIITKSNKLIPLFKSHGARFWRKYGKSTTWMSKLKPRIRGGGAGRCPVVVFAIKPSAYVADVPDENVAGFADRVKNEFRAWKEEQKATKRAAAEARRLQRTAEQQAARARREQDRQALRERRTELRSRTSSRTRKATQTPPASDISLKDRPGEP